MSRCDMCNLTSLSLIVGILAAIVDAPVTAPMSNLYQHKAMQHFAERDV
jgi:hypothetical protein